MMIWNPLYLGKARDGGSISRKGKGGTVIYIIVGKEPPESNLSGSIYDTETSRSQQAAGAAELLGQRSFFMQILEIITSLGKTQLNEMAGRQTDLSFKNMILKYK